MIPSSSTQPRSRRPGWSGSRIAGHALSVASALAIAGATLAPGDPAVQEETSLLCVVCGRHGLTDVALNLALFVPLGLGLRVAGLRLWACIVAGALLSFAVESVQYSMLVGRSASLSDLLFNTIGTAVGAFAAHHSRLLLRPAPRVAARLAAGSTLAVLALLGISGWALVPHFPPPPYAVNQIASDAGVMRPFEAVILRSTLAGREYPPPRRIPAALEALEARPLDPSFVSAEAEVEPMYPPGMLRPLVLLSAADSSTLLVLGQRERSLLLRQRVRGGGLRLVAPSFALPNAFPGRDTLPSAEASSRAGPLRVAAMQTRSTIELRSEGPAGTLSRTIQRTPLLGWTMLLPFGIAHGARGELITALWAMALLLPGAYWSGRARPLASWAPLAQLVLVLAGVLAMARLLGLAPPVGLPLAGLLIASWGGAALGAWTIRRLASPSFDGQVTAS